MPGLTRVLWCINEVVLLNTSIAYYDTWIIRVQQDRLLSMCVVINMISKNQALTLALCCGQMEHHNASTDHVMSKQ